MKEEKKEIAVNVSSGAEKVQSIEQEIKRTPSGKTQEKTVKKTQTKPKQKTDTATKTKIEKERKRAEERVVLAKRKKEEKEQKKAKRLENAKKRRAERNARIEKYRAERRARMEKLLAEEKARIEKKKAECETKIRERAHAKATKAQEKNRNKSARKEKNHNNRERKNNGGWIATVVSLGVVTLALSAIVTVGAIDMKRTKDSMISGYRATTYELMGVMEHLDNDLDRARISASPTAQARILTDLLVQARVAEIDLEKLPIDGQSDKNLTAFINRVGAECERMLSKLRKGEKLNEKDGAILQNLYEINHAIRQEWNAYANTMSNYDLMQLMKNGECEFKKVLEKVENATLPENRPQEQVKDSPAPSTNDSPTAKIEVAKAEDLCKGYFSDYKIQDFQCIGETVGRGYTAYNVQGYDNEGTLLFAEVDCKTGALIRFNYYKDCNEDKFTLDNGKQIAQEFLAKLGYENMTAVRVRENGTDADYTFVYEQDGVVYYPDEIKVKICRTRGLVSGFDGGRYLMNHTTRNAPSVSLSLDEAKSKLHKALTVESARLALVKTINGEKTAYEFVCAYGEEKYVVYSNAENGEEIAIINLKNLR